MFFYQMSILSSLLLKVNELFIITLFSYFELFKTHSINSYEIQLEVQIVSLWNKIILHVMRYGELYKDILALIWL